MKLDTNAVIGTIQDVMNNYYLKGCERVHAPDVPGSNNNVFFADTPYDGTRVFKVNTIQMANKNKAVSRLLTTDANVPVPHIQTLVYKGYTFEVYPEIPGRTLYSEIGDGKYTAGQITDVYRQMLRIMRSMEFISSTRIPDMPMIQSHEVARAEIDENKHVLRHIMGAAVRGINGGDKNNMGLYHFDMTPKNILVDDAGHITGVVDMDSVGVCDVHFALAMLCAKYARMGFPINELLDFYAGLTHKKLNTGRVRRLVDITNLGKTIMWHSKHNHQK